MSGRKPHRPYSRHKHLLTTNTYGPPQTRGSMALDFANDDFAFADRAPTPRDVEFWRLAGSGKVAPVKRQPKTEPEWYQLVRDFTPTQADIDCYGGVHALIKAAPVRTLALPSACTDVWQSWELRYRGAIIPHEWRSIVLKRALARRGSHKPLVTPDVIYLAETTKAA